MKSLGLSLFLLLFSGALAVGAGNLYWKYKVSWLGIPAGKIRIYVEKEGTFLKLRAVSKTTGMVRLFFPFKSKWTTWVDERGYPVKSRIWRKSRGKEVLKEYFFDQEKGLVTRRKKGRTSTYKLKHYPVYDELSAFWATTKLVFEKPGEEKVLWVFAHKKANPAFVRYLKDEEVGTSCGTLKAQKLEVRFGFESELIKRSKKAYLWKWKEFIVKSQGELAIGHVTGKLVNLDCKEVKGP